MDVRKVTIFTRYVTYYVNEIHKDKLLSVTKYSFQALLLYLMVENKKNPYRQRQILYCCFWCYC